MPDNNTKRPARAQSTASKENGGSPYFLSLSKKYKKASRIIYIALAVSFVVTLVFNARLLTYDNFNYLIRDLNSAAEVAADNYNSISYTNDEMRTSKSFRGGIITVSGTDMAIYTATGRKTLFMNDTFVSPQISTSKKYAVVYDHGGKKYSVYNSFAKVHSETLEYPISSVSVADNGWYAVVTKDESHTSVVKLYDDDFDLRYTYSFASDYVFFANLNAKGNKLAIVKSKTALDKFSTSLMVVEPGKDKANFDIKISDAIPYGGGFLSGGDLQIATAEGYRMYDADNGNLKEEYSFNGASVNHVSFGDDGCAISLENNTGVVINSILVFDKKGKLVYNTNVDRGILDLEYADECIYINQGDTVSKIDVDKEKTSTVKLSEIGSDIIVYDNGNILLCCKTKAKYIKL